ncbi:MAG: HD domain-containing protein [Sulfolobaceae archaeon]
MKIIRDPIHGFIEVSEAAYSIISTPIFQRLRYITQTGLSYMVYPGMRHSRFEHSLGVYHLAKDFIKFIKNNAEEKIDFATQEYEELIAILGLLHDIGHLPFSHTFENALSIARIIYDLDVIDYNKKTHEVLGLKIISEYLSKVLERVSKGTNISDPIKFLIRAFSDPKTVEERLAKLIISNFIDADRSDYLLRDSYYAGVDYGWFDIERLKRTLVFVDNNLVIDYKGLPIVEQFLIARMYMFRNVYFHSVVGMYNAILAHAIAHLLKKGEISIPESEKDFIKMTDIKILNKLDKIREEFKNAILYRRGFKRIKQDITIECLKILDIKEIIETVRENEGLFIYHEFQDAPYSEDENSAVYILHRGKIVNLSSLSTLVNSLKLIKKGIIVYHESLEDKIEKYKKLIQNC